MPFRVVKRNGEIEPFDFNKIKTAMKKAFIACNKEMPEELVEDVKFSFNIHSCIDMGVERIQDLVENRLMDSKFYDVAKAYILYRDSHKQTRFIKERLDYMTEYSKSSYNAATASETDANSNVAIKNVANLEGEVYKTTNRIIQRQRMKEALNKLYPEVAKKYEEDLDSHIIYVHDESSTPTLKAYCMAASLFPLMNEGTGNIDGITPSPPNDIQSFCGQFTNLIFLLSSQVKGAVATSEVFIALNYYIIKEFGKDWVDKLDEVCQINGTKDRTIRNVILKGMKQIIYGINQPAGNRGYNSPFTNFAYFDKTYFNALFEHFYYPDGTQPEWKQIDTLQRMFCKLHRELRLIKPLTFPVNLVAA